MAPTIAKKSLAEKRDVWTEKETSILVDSYILKKVLKLSPIIDVFFVNMHKYVVGYHLGILQCYCNERSQKGSMGIHTGSPTT